MSDTMQVNITELKPLIKDCMEVGLVPMVWGPPGAGKSATIFAIAKEHNLKVIDVRLTQCDPTDLNGFPKLDGEKATYVPMDTFPIESDELPVNPETGEQYAGWILFLDELSSASRTVQAAAYKIALDKEVGQHKLHPKCFVVGAGNGANDGAISNRMSTALQSRLIHYSIGVDSEAWVKHAILSGYDYRMIAYINFRPETLSSFNPNHTDLTFACQRTCEFASRLLKLSPTDFPATKLPHLIGTLGNGVGRELFGFLQIFEDLPTIDQMVNKPDTVEVPSEPGNKYAIIGCIAEHVNDDTIDPLLSIILRFPLEFQVIGLRQIIGRNRNLIRHEKVAKWIKENSKELF